jgi:hypothetical protein
LGAQLCARSTFFWFLWMFIIALNFDDVGPFWGAVSMESLLL